MNVWTATTSSKESERKSSAPPVNQAMSIRSDEFVRIGFDEILYLSGRDGIIGVVKAGVGQWFIETEDEEIALFTEEDDLFVASGFGTDEQIVKGIGCMLYLVRDVGSPLIVLPKDHPASGRLKIVVSAGAMTTIRCDITPGTHPEQDVLCGGGEFDGVRITGVAGGVRLHNIDPGKIDIRTSKI